MGACRVCITCHVRTGACARWFGILCLVGVCAWQGPGASQPSPSGQSAGDHTGQGEQSSDVGGVTELMRGASLTEPRALAGSKGLQRPGVDLGECGFASAQHHT